MYGQVYMRFCRLSKKCYIGQTTKDHELRWKGGYDECPAFYKALQKYGRENFESVILAETNNQEELDNAEAEFIKIYNTLVPFGYNLLSGGHGNGRTHPLTAAKISAANKGRIRYPEEIAKSAKSNRGKKRSEEAKANMRKAAVGRRPSQLAIDNARIAVQGKTKSLETRQRMSAAQKGGIRSPEMRLKISESLKRRHQEKLAALGS